MSRILIIHGHPDAGGDHFGDALVQRYTEAAESAGHSVDIHRVNESGLPMVTSAAEWNAGPVPDGARDAQRRIEACDHLVFFYPLWMGDMPALLKAWLEQVFRPGFAFDEAGGGMPRRRLAGKSARIVVTMGMPALIYRMFYRAHSVVSFKRNILRFAGIGPVRLSLIGLVDGSPRNRERWLARMQRCGAKAR